jgi:hypothetical protein
VHNLDIAEEFVAIRASRIHDIAGNGQRTVVCRLNTEEVLASGRGIASEKGAQVKAAHGCGLEVRNPCIAQHGREQVDGVRHFRTGLAWYHTRAGHQEGVR